MLSNLLRHRRAVVLAALVTVTAAAWVYLLLGAGTEMEMMDMGNGQVMAMQPGWDPPHTVLVLVMWVI